MEGDGIAGGYLGSGGWRGGSWGNCGASRAIASDFFEKHQGQLKNFVDVIL